MAELKAGIASVLGLVPDWVVAVAVLSLVVIFGLIVQDLAVRLLSRRLGRWRPLWRALFVRTQGVVRFALVVLAIRITTPLVPMGAETAAILGKAMVAALIALGGWAALVAVDIAAGHYQSRLPLSTANNLHIRKLVTQIGVLKQTANITIVIITIGLALMSFDSVRQIGISLFASAGIAGIALGLAAQPILKNLVAGMQLALAQPIRIDDVVIVEGEWGRIEEISATYVVIQIWDLRRLVVPLSYFLEKPFQNWTRTSSDILGTVFLYTDYSVPVQQVRDKLEEIARASPNWDGKVVGLQVTDSKDRTLELRALVSSSDSSKSWDLRCEVREKLVAYIQENFPGALPRQRGETPVSGASDLIERPLDAGAQPRPITGAKMS